MDRSAILIVEDEPSIAEVVGIYLRRAGYQVTILQDGQSALDYLSQRLPDLVILDVMLPKIDGLRLTGWLRDQSDVPIILLTARREEADRIAGLELGADDYVVKPFSPQELVSRVRAVLRRIQSKANTQPEEPLTYPALSINPLTRQVISRSHEVSLTSREYDLLWLLAAHPRQVFTRAQLLEQIWGQSEYIDPSTVTVHIRRLREKIELDPSKPDHLQTVWGVGYKFVP
jgi:DNA-binding response OmpR family regulator